MSNKKIKVLLIDDDKNICEVIKSIVETETDYQLIFKTEVDNIIELLEEEKPNLILLDIMLIGKSGYNLCRVIKNHPDYMDIPVIMITAVGNPAKALEIGADDFITKPFSNSELLKKISFLLKRSLSIDLELTHKKKRQTCYYKDKITNLPILEEIIQKISSEISDDDILGLVYIDIAKFDKIEELYGWTIFERIISNMSKIIINMPEIIIGKKRYIAVTRQCGDDFVILTYGSKKDVDLSETNMSKIKDSIFQYLKENINYITENTPVKHCDFFIGCSNIPINKNKKFQRIVYQALKDSMVMAYKLESKKSSELKELLNKVISEKDINVLYQPIIDIKTLKTIGYEALARGPKDTMFVNPEIMFNIAKEENLVVELDKICHKKAIENTNFDELLFINVEVKSFENIDYKQLAKENKFGLPKEKLVLEITERTSIEDINEFIKVIDIYKNSGYKIAIDDVGSGYASLLFIAKIDPDILKIDNLLIRNIDSNKSKFNIVSALCNYAQQQNITVIAEGVETLQEYETLLKLNIDYVQGFFFASPSLNTKIKSFQEKVNS